MRLSIQHYIMHGYQVEINMVTSSFIFIYLDSKYHSNNLIMWSCNKLWNNAVLKIYFSINKSSRKSHIRTV